MTIHFIAVRLLIMGTIYKKLFLWEVKLLSFSLFPGSISRVFLQYDKHAFYCDLRKPCDEILDDRGSAMTDKCTYVAFVSIDLVELYSIQTVLIELISGTPRRLRDFTIYLNEGSLHAFCSDFIGSFEYQQYNCAQWPKLFSEVQINSPYNEGIMIYSIAISSLATGLPDVRHVLLYRGCFANFGDKDMEYEWSVCYPKCFRKNFIFAGIKDNKYCACADNIDINEELTLSECDLKCIDGIRYCGGRTAYSVYIVKVPLPYYVGCYESSEYYTEKAIYKKSIKIRECIEACDNHRYAILQNKEYCICDDEIINIEERKLSNNCDLKCNDSIRGQYMEFCGGRTYKSVYSTCKQGLENSITCSKLFNCAEFSVNPRDYCEACARGFSGDFCLSKGKFTDPDETDDNLRNRNFITYYMDLIVNTLIRQWHYILLLLSLTIVGIVMWFKSPCGNFRRWLPAFSEVPAVEEATVQKENESHHVVIDKHVRRHSKAANDKPKREYSDDRVKTKPKKEQELPTEETGKKPKREENDHH